MPHYASPSTDIRSYGSQNFRTKQLSNFRTKQLSNFRTKQLSLYCVPCGNCDQKYFGETKRSFNTRKKEHINYIKHFHPEKSALAKHTLELDHRMNWSKTQIVAFENAFRKRRFIESFFINSTPNVINEKSSDLFPNIYKATFGCD